MILLIFQKEEEEEEVYTSLQVAEWTGKRHSDVLKDIRNEMEKLEELAQRIFSLGSYKDSNNQERVLFNTTK